MEWTENYPGESSSLCEFYVIGLRGSGPALVIISGFDYTVEHQSSGKLKMTAVNRPEVSVVKSVTVITPGADFSNLYESLIDQLGISPQFLEELTPPKLLIDMHHVKFVGSAFLGRMVFIHKTLSAREAGRVAMCGLNSFCRAALTVSKLDTVLEVFSTVDEGVAAFEV